MIKREAIFTFMIAVMMAVTCITPVFYSGDHGSISAQGLPNSIDQLTPQPGDGYIWIDSPDKLALIGSDPVNYPWEGNYVLQNDIVFGSSDTNLGETISFNIVLSAGKLTVDLTPLTNPMYVFLGDAVKETAAGVTEFDYDPSLSYRLVLGGNSGSADFAHIMDIPASFAPSNPVTFSSNGNFTPLGSASDPFTGTFNGNGYRIDGINTITYNDGTADVHSGLFGYVSGAKISNLILENGSSSMVSNRISTTAYPATGVGGIVGYSAGPLEIENCYTSNDVTLVSTSSGISPTYIHHALGGMAGYSNSNVILDSCVNEGSIFGAYVASSITGRRYAYIHEGGLVGYALNVEADNCRNAGTIGIDINIKDSVGVQGYAAGIAGNVGFSATVGSISTYRACINEGAVTGHTTISNISTVYPGRLYSSGIVNTISAYTEVDMTDCSNTADISVVSDPRENSTNNEANRVEMYAAGLCNLLGRNQPYATKIMRCHNTGNIKVTVLGDPNANVTGHRYAAGLIGYANNHMSLSECYNTGNITVNSRINGDTNSSVFAGGLIGNSGRYDGIVDIISCYNTGDVTAESIVGAPSFTTSYTSLGGIAGWIGVLRMTDTHNVGDISVQSTANITATGSIDASAHTGGLAGHVYYRAEISRSCNEGSVSSDITRTLSSTSATSDVRSNSYTGGLIGKIDIYSVGPTKIENCYNTGNVDSVLNNTLTSPRPTMNDSFTGGLIGRATKHDTTVDNCYVSGTVENTTTGTAVSNVGGIIGYAGEPGEGHVSINFSYFIENSADAITGSGNPVIDGGYTGPLESSTRTAEEMKLKSTFFDESQNKGWDFTNVIGIWSIDASVNGGYPTLNPMYSGTDYVVFTPTTDNPSAYVITPTGAYGFNQAVPGGTPFTFTVDLRPGYSGMITVTVNGTVVSDVNGTYTITGNAGDAISISIGGAETSGAVGGGDKEFNIYLLILLALALAITYTVTREYLDERKG